VLEDPAPRTHERLVVGAHAHGAQRGIALDGAIDVALRRVVIGFPRAVGALRFEQRRHEILLPRVAVAQEVHGQQPFCFHAVVRLEHADPEAFGCLVSIEPGDRACDRGVDSFRRRIQGSRRRNSHRYR
jgi:hypothetical protein